MHTKLLIIGSGPAGYTAAIYGARANLNPILITGMQPGGQLMITTDVENYPGFSKVIQGPWLMSEMQAQAEHVGTQIVLDLVTKVDLSHAPFKCWTESGQLYTCDSLVISTGAQAKWLGIPSEKEFLGYGVSGCATCDGFFFKNKKVAIVGGGNTAVEEALYLTNHAAEVTLIHRRDSLRAEKIAQDRLLKNPKIKVIWNHVVEEVLGNKDPKQVTGLRLKSTADQTEQTISVDGFFVAIGHSPSSETFKEFINTDAEGYIMTKSGSTQTNIPGVFAAGDVQDKVFRQAVTAAGQGCMAAIEAERFLSH